MTKYKSFLFLASCGFLLAGCGKTETNEMDTSEGATSTDISTNVSTELEETEEIESNARFNGEIATLEDLDVKIIDHKLVSVVDTENEDDETLIIVFRYEATNKSDQDINPDAAWTSIFEAVQGHNSSEQTSLQVTSLPDDTFLESQSKTIEQDETIESAIAYELIDDFTPVVLIATEGIGGRELGGKYFYIE